MASNEDIILLLTKISDNQLETSRNIAGLDKKLDLHIQQTEFELSNIHRQDEIQNRLLDEHIAASNTLKAIFERHDEEDKRRFDILEAPKKERQQMFKRVAKILAVLGGIGTACAGLLELAMKLRGH